MSDDLSVSSGTYVLSSSSSFDSLSLTGNGTIALSGNTLSVLDSSLGSDSGEGIDGAGNFLTTGTTVISASQVSFERTQLALGGGVVWTNTGTVSDAGSIATSDNSGLTATIVNQAGASFDLTADGAGVFNANGYTGTVGSSTFANAGTLAKTNGTGTSYIQSFVTNTGTISVEAGTLEFDGGGTFGGTIGGSGVLAFGGGTSTLAANVDLTSANILISGGTLATDGDLAIDDSLSLTGNGTIALSGNTLSVLDSSLGSDSGEGIDGAGNFLTTGTTVISASQVSFERTQLALGGGVVWTNTGTVSDAGSIATSDNSGLTATIVNQAGASFDLTADGAGVFNANGYTGTVGSSTFANAGTLAKTNGTGTSYIQSFVTNTGTISVEAGTLEFDGGGTFGGTIGGSGVLAFGGGASTLAAGLKLTVANLAVSGGTLELAGSTIAPQSLNVLSGGTLAGFGSVLGSITNAGQIDAVGGQLTVTGSVTGSGTVFIATGASVELSSDSSNTLTFGGQGETLILDRPSLFTGTISKFGLGDILQFAGIQAVKASLSGSVLTVGLANDTTLEFNMAGDYKDDIFGVRNGNVAIIAQAENQPPIITVPGDEIIQPGNTQPISGISIADGDAVLANETITVTIADESGLLSAATNVPGGGGSITGSGTANLQISGSLSQVNADLATLQYMGTLPSDSISISANDGRGGTDDQTINVTSPVIRDLYQLIDLVAGNPSSSSAPILLNQLKSDENGNITSILSSPSLTQTILNNVPGLDTLGGPSSSNITQSLGEISQLVESISRGNIDDKTVAKSLDDLLSVTDPGEVPQNFSSSLSSALDELTSEVRTGAPDNEVENAVSAVYNKLDFVYEAINGSEKTGVSALPNPIEDKENLNRFNSDLENAIRFDDGSIGSKFVISTFATFSALCFVGEAAEAGIYSVTGGKLDIPFTSYFTALIQMEDTVNNSATSILEKINSVIAFIGADLSLAGSVQPKGKIALIGKYTGLFEQAIGLVRSLLSKIHFSATAQGDVHLTTYDGLYYNFQATGEFTLSKATNAGDSFDTQIRLEAFNQSATVSVITQVASMVGTDRVTFALGRDSTVWVNGQASSISTDNPLIPLSGGVLAEVSPGQYDIVWNTGEVLEVTNQGSCLNVSASLGPNDGPGSVVGLLGGNSGQSKDFQLADGTVLSNSLTSEQLYGEFADAWRVSQSTSLLDYGAGQSTATFTDKNFPQDVLTLADLPQDLVNQAAAAVAAAGITNPALIAGAELDYLATNDPNFLTGALNAQQQGQQTIVVNIPPPPPAPPPPLAGVTQEEQSVEESDSGATTVTFNVYLTGMRTTATTLNYAVMAQNSSDLGAAAFGGTLPSGQVTIAAGATSAEFNVSLPEGALGTSPSATLAVGIGSSGGTGVFAPVAQTTIVNNARQAGDNAIALLQDLTGLGALSQTGNSYTLDLGTLTLGQSPQPIQLALRNVGDAAADQLSGEFSSASGSGFTLDPATSISPISPSQSLDFLSLTALTTSVGDHTETIAFFPTDSNTTGYSVTLPTVTLTVTDSVVQALAITAQSALSVTAGQRTAVAGISVADPVARTQPTITVAVSDSTGLLTADAASGGNITGSGSNKLTLSGSLTAVNSELSSLAYISAPIGASSNDVINISTSDSNGATDDKTIQVSIDGLTGFSSWKTKANGDWSASANWQGNVPNGASINAAIATKGTYSVTIDGAEAFAVGSLALFQSAGSLKVNGNLSVAATLGMAPGLLYLDGSLLDQGSATATATITGTVMLKGAKNARAISLSGNRGELRFVGTQTLDNAALMAASTQTAFYAISGSLTLGQHLSILQAGSAGHVMTFAGNGAIINDAIINLSASQGLATISCDEFSNNGTITVSNGDMLSIRPSVFTNLSGTTLAGGEFQVDSNSTIELNTDATVGTDDAKIVLSGSGSKIQSYNSASGKEIAIESTLTTVGAKGFLSVVGNRNFQSAKAITDAGTIILGGGTFSATGLSITARATISGAGVLATTVSDAGKVEASGGTLKLLKTVTGAGILQVDTQSGLIIDGAVAKTSTVLFDGTKATVSLGDAKGFSGSIAGLAAGDQIDLLGTKADGVLLLSSSKLEVMNGGKSVVTLALSGDIGKLGFSVKSDGQGGTSLVAVEDTSPGLSSPHSIRALSGQVSPLISIKLTDPGPASAFTVTLTDKYGKLSVQPSHAVSVTGSGSTKLTMSGTLAGIQSELATLKYTGAQTGEKPTLIDTLTTTAIDNLGRSSTAATAITIYHSSPVTVVPKTATVTSGTATAIRGISVTDTDSFANETLLTETLTDKIGTLSASAVKGVTLKGVGTKSLILTGGLAAVNRALATVTYKGSLTGTKTTIGDTVAVKSSDGFGNSNTKQFSVVITKNNSVTPSVAELSPTLSLFQQYVAAGISCPLALAGTNPTQVPGATQQLTLASPFH